MVSLGYRGPGNMDLEIQEVRLPYPLVAPPQPHQTLTVRGRTAYLTTAGGAAGVAWEEDHLGIMMSVDASLGEARLLDVAEHLRPLGQK